MIMNKIVDMVREQILDRFQVNCKEEWLCVLSEWYNHYEGKEGDYILKVIHSLEDNDWMKFRMYLMMYLKEQGHKVEYVRLGFLSPEYIEGCFEYRTIYSSECDDPLHITFKDKHNEDEYDLYDNEKMLKWISEYFEDFMELEIGDKMDFYVIDETGPEDFDIEVVFDGEKTNISFIK